MGEVNKELNPQIVLMEFCPKPPSFRDISHLSIILFFIKKWI